MRSPVNAPGPQPKAIAARLLGANPCEASMLPMRGSNSADASAPPGPFHASVEPPEHSATVIISVEVSNARIACSMLAV